jgi:acetolactate synthase regulatory subunit
MNNIILPKKHLRDYETSKKIKHAKHILCEMFEVSLNDLSEVGKRNLHIVEARRFLIHYMYRELVLPYQLHKRYISGINHATCIHHRRKLAWDITHIESIRNLYMEFIIRASSEEILIDLIDKKRSQIDLLELQIEKLKKEIKNDRQEEKLHSK